MPSHSSKKKECPATFTLNEDKTFRCKEHSHDAMKPIQCEIMKIMSEIPVVIANHPTIQIKNLYDQKEIELIKKFDAKQVAQYWPEFDSKDSAFFVQRNKLIPKLPTSINDLQDLPDDYKITISKERFLASKISLVNT